VDFQIYSAAQAASAVHRGNVVRQELAGTNGDAPAAGLVRDALLARGLKGAALQNAEQEFASSALSHAQTALQHAYALDRLGTILQRAGESSLSPDARVKWTQMVERHSSATLTELQVLRLQLIPFPRTLRESPPLTRLESRMRRHLPLHIGASCKGAIGERGGCEAVRRQRG